MLITQNIDNLFDRPSYSAVVAGRCNNPNWTSFNSGLMVIEPSKELFQKLLNSIEPAMYKHLKDGEPIGDQDIFNEAFIDWKEHPELELPENTIVS